MMLEENVMQTHPFTYSHKYNSMPKESDEKRNTRWKKYLKMKILKGQ